MKRLGLGGVACLVLALAVGAQGATEFWITNNTDGTKASVPAGGTYPELTVEPNTPITVHAFLSTTDAGTGFEMFIGYDQSNGSTQGLHKDTNDGAFKKLVLNSWEDNMSDVFTSNHVINPDATSREASNSLFGGRLYGVQVYGGKPNPASTFSNKMIATFNFTNNLAVNESTYIILSNNGSGASYTNYWSNAGTILARPEYVLKVTAVPEPISMILLGLGGLGLLRRRS